MDCNPDDALRIKELAESKFLEKDYAGAKKLATRAQSLLPSLEGIGQMIAIIDIHLASEVKVNGEKNWYAVLHVNTSADEDTVKRHYRKLSLMLHPDKNKSAGAENAFQLVSEAWSVLSDKNQKMLYDQKISGKVPFQRTSQPANHSSSPCFESNGVYQFAGNAATRVKTRQSNSCRPSCPPIQTFWTSCAACCMQYEYHRMYLNKSLLCPKCKQPFLATELPVPPSEHYNLQWHSNQTKYKTNEHFPNQNVHWASFTGVGPNGLPTNQAHNAKKQREEAKATIKKEEALRRKLSRRTAITSANLNTLIASDNCEAGRTDSGNHSVSNSFTERVPSKMVVNSNSFHEIDNGSRLSSDSCKQRSISRPSNFYTQGDVKAILIEKAKDRIQKKLREFYLSETTSSEINDRTVLKKIKLKDVKVTKIGDRGSFKYKVQRDSVQLIDCSISNDTHKQVNHHLAIDVPDSDFHDFDSDRSEKAFGADQVWATYDDDDGMPRYYAFIQKVLCAKPFKARMSFLTSKSNVEFGPLDWVGSGFPKTCGDFRVGRYVVANMINIFSHRVKWEKGFRGVIKVLPRKGDIWALYRNWSPNWNELTPDDLIHKYEMVEVLEDFSEDHGISVVPLVKVAGFKTVFLRHMDPKENKRIPKQEMFRFSHQVPSYLLTGEEAQNAPKDCLELDPAATSIELLQVLTETKDEDMKMNDNGISRSNFHPNVHD